jgi:hypothetical protein
MAEEEGFEPPLMTVGDSWYVAMFSMIPGFEPVQITAKNAAKASNARSNRLLLSRATRFWPDPAQPSDEIQVIDSVDQPPRAL